MMRRYEIVIKATVDESAIMDDVPLERAVGNYVKMAFQDDQYFEIRSIKARRTSK